MQGLAWVNGFNLGWYWPAAGPQMTTFVPGPLLRAGGNDVVLLETLCAPADEAGAHITCDKSSSQCLWGQCQCSWQSCSATQVFRCAPADEPSVHIRECMACTHHHPEDMVCTCRVCRHCLSVWLGQEPGLACP